MTQAIAKAHEHIREICELQIELAQKVNVVKAVYPPGHAEPVVRIGAPEVFEEIKQAKRTEGKQARAEAVSALKERVERELIPAAESEDKALEEKFSAAWQSLVAWPMRELILSGTRADGRDNKTLRPIEWLDRRLAAGPWLSRLPARRDTGHGHRYASAPARDEQRVDGLLDEYAQKFMPCVLLSVVFGGRGAAHPRPWPSRNQRRASWPNGASSPCCPQAEDFPYTITIISDILESNGSSSMATRLRHDAGTHGRRSANQQPGCRHFDRPGQGSGWLDPVDRYHRR